MAAAQTRYKNDYDKKARREPQMRVGDEVYIDQRQHAAYASDSAEEFA